MEDKSGNSLEEFKASLIGGKHVVDFYATWCQPCKIITPILEEISSEQVEASFSKIDVEQSADVTEHYGITSVPTILFFKDGELKGRIQGAVPKKKMLTAIEDYLGD